MKLPNPTSNAPAPASNAVVLCSHCSLPVPRYRQRVLGRERGESASRAGSSTVDTSQFCCFGCRFAFELSRPVDGDAPGTGAAVTRHGTLLFRLGLSTFISMNMMMLSGYFYAREIYLPSSGDAPPLDPLGSLFAYLLMLMCTVVIALLGVPLAADALSNAFRPTGRRLDANLLICVGVGAAYMLSVIHTLRGQGGLYFDTAAMILVLVALGQFLDSSAKRSATKAVCDLLSNEPETAWVQRGDAIVEVSAREVNVGEKIRVRAGEEFAVDGRVIEGLSRVTETSLTGESMPRAVEPGSRVLAGTVNLDGLLWVEAHAVGQGRAVVQIGRLLEEARTRQAPIQRAADRASAFFLPFVIVLAVAVFAIHSLNGGLALGLFNALAVLLISCPCALGLAAPLATWSALARAARQGILFDSATTLERAAGVRTVFFDKTGTLTEPRLRVVSVDAYTGDIDDALRIAAALEASSVHPIAASILDAAREKKITPPLTAWSKLLPGLGIEACIDSGVFRLGSRRLTTESQIVLERISPPEHAVMEVFLFSEHTLIARFLLAEKLRAGAAAALDELRRVGVELGVLTGDQLAAGRRLANALGVPVESELLPGQKVERLMAARRRMPRGQAVAMVGDGVNDAPVMAAADVGFAVGGAADLATQAGNIRLISERLDRVPLALAIARHAMRRVHLNLAWSFGYNAIGLALAVMGWLNPIFAAAAMFASSLFIVISSRGAGAIDQRFEASNALFHSPREAPHSSVGLASAAVATGS